MFNKKGYLNENKNNIKQILMKEIIIYKENVEDEKLDICTYVWKYNKKIKNRLYKCILCEKHTKKLFYTFFDISINIYLPYCGKYCAINNIYITEIRYFLKINLKYINKLEIKKQIQTNEKIIYIGDN